MHKEMEKSQPTNLSTIQTQAPIVDISTEADELLDCQIMRNWGVVARVL